MLKGVTMGLIVETGAGLSTANSYATADEGDSYFDGMLETVWDAASSDAKDAALMKATIYIDGAYQDRFQGVRKTETQALEWPRSGVLDHGYLVSDAIVPLRVKWATCQAALRSLSGDLTPDVKEQVVEIQVGPIKKTVKSAGISPKYPVVERLLRPILFPSATGQMVVGR